MTYTLSCCLHRIPRDNNNNNNNIGVQDGNQTLSLLSLLTAILISRYCIYLPKVNAGLAMC
ncbi:hypothetical protein T4B_12010 [Trichinella pseudospiralis]|uniref:Uncharacterized protein n=1 Tax=Trichinella pseudospiralis TaxID=6337 RepID=A0A0V1JHP0_TRIPS|nr:hypothetical protein T4A_3862 [Trichinella pseudospiralis]KRZ34463.1 hypothetical protein T4B_12010 [Trichinella pseudospiralis]